MDIPSQQSRITISIVAAMLALIAAVVVLGVAAALSPDRHIALNSDTSGDVVTKRTAAQGVAAGQDYRKSDDSQGSITDRREEERGADRRQQATTATSSRRTARRVPVTTPATASPRPRAEPPAILPTLPRPALPPSSSPAQPGEVITLIPGQSNSTVINVTDERFGAKGDGLSDDTIAIQRAIDYAAAAGGGVVEIPSGTYMINSTLNASDGQFGLTGLYMRSNVTVRMTETTTLQAMATSSSHYAIFRLSGVENAHIAGGTLVGDRANHQGEGGEWGHGVSIVSSKKVVIEGVRAKEFWGDGFYIGGNVAHRSRDIILHRVTAEGNRRQGLSIVDGVSIKVLRSVFRTTHGTAPSAGIDIEPEHLQSVTRVEIRDSVMSGNLGSGVALVKRQENQATIKDIVIEGNTLVNNGYGVMVLGATDSQIIGNRIHRGVLGEDDYTIHLSSTSRQVQVIDNVLLGGAIIDQGVNNRVASNHTHAGVYLKGEIKAGGSVVAEVSDGDGVPQDKVIYRWYKNGQLLASETERYYHIGMGDAGKTIAVEVSFVDAAGNAETAQSDALTIMGP